MFNEKDGSIFAKVTNSPINREINYTTEFREKLQEHIDHNIPIVVFHNHPQGTPPSSDDFRKAYENQYSFSIVDGHNGQLYRYETPKEEVSKVLSDAIATEIGRMTSGGTDVDRACKMIYDEFKFKYTIIEGGENA